MTLIHHISIYKLAKILPTKDTQTEINSHIVVNDIENVIQAILCVSDYFI